MTTETQAYLDGNIELADALARIVELEAEVEALEEKIEDTKTLESWEEDNGSAKEYYEFFHDCFAPSDYDKSIIFADIERGEEVAE